MNRRFYYWGEGGQYGPFAVQTGGEWAGWPDFGQVMRYFRKKVKPPLSAQKFGEIYGKEAEEGHAVTERWVLRMELENKVPLDINKRKTIARLLNIPPMLFGLAVIDDLTLESYLQSQVSAKGQTRLTKVEVDTTKYQSNVRTIWQMHDTGAAQSELGHIETDIRELEILEEKIRGDLRNHLQEILFGCHLLACHVVRDERRFNLAYTHANEAVRVAKSLNDSDYTATAFFMRGWTRLEWGLYGTAPNGVFQVQQDKLEAAIRDFENAKNVFPVQDGKEYMHPQLLGALTVYLSRAQAALATSRGEQVPVSTLVALDDIADTVGRQHIDDIYTRALVTGTRKSWHKAGYLNTRATVFNTAGQPGHALKELNALESLVEKSYRRDETRQFVWLDLLKSNVYMGLGELGPATEHARKALLACQDINSVTNLSIITDIYERLQRSSHKGSSDVKELGDLLMYMKS